MAKVRITMYASDKLRMQMTEYVDPSPLQLTFAQDVTMLR